EVRVEAERVRPRGVVDGQRPWGQGHLTTVLDEQTVSIELKRDLEAVRRAAVSVRPGPGDQPGGAQNGVRIGVDLRHHDRIVVACTDPSGESASALGRGVERDE